MAEFTQIITVIIWLSILAFFSFFAGHTVLDLIEKVRVIFPVRRADSSRFD